MANKFVLIFYLKEKLFGDLEKFRFPNLNLVPSPIDGYMIDYRNSVKIYSRYMEVNKLSRKPRADIEIDRYIGRSTHFIF